MLALYHWEPNLYFLKPLIALAEKGIEFDSHYFDPMQFEQFAVDFPGNAESRLQLELEGPVLVHEGAIISSSFFMLEYIAEALPGPSLLPRDAHGRYRMRAFGQSGAVLLGGAVATLGCARYLGPALRRHSNGALRTRIAAIEPSERRARWAALLEDSQEGAVSAALGRLQRPVERIEAALSGSPWLAGTDYSIADIDAYALLAPLPTLAPDVVSGSATPNITAFLTRMQSRPGVRAALARSRTGRPAEAFVPGAEASRWG
ncbi:MAG TPA: glutathione S-transferase family protein [Steroidobacteraceae bacterium]|jgi:glutathione S-transferase/GST-like protein